MNNERPDNNPAVAIPISKGPIEIKSVAARWLGSGRNAVLNGWLISMLGIVLYCFAMLGGSADVDPFSSILERGWMGAGAIALLVVGMLLWLYGAITFLREVEEKGPGGCGPSF